MAAEENDIQAALAELSAAQEHHAQCAAENRATSSALTSAVNRLNRAQKDVDKCVEALRKDAPWDTDWNKPRGIPAQS